MKNFLIILFLLISAKGLAYEKDSLKTSNFKHELGFHIGSTSGYGLSYRVWYKKIGLQASFYPNINKGNNTNYTFVYGVNLDYKLKQSKFVDAYYFVGGSASSKKTYNTCYFEPWLCSEPKFHHSINLGTGLGLDFKFADAMVLSTQFGYGIYSINNFYQGNIAGGISLLYKL